MRILQPLLLTTMLGVGVFATQVAPAFAQTCSCPPVQDQGAGAPAGVAVYADEAPPPLPDYDQPPIPAVGYMWTPGYWAWNGYEYFWVPGTWIEPPQPGLLWTPGYWAFVGGVYAFHRGYWGEHVGFYGGVDYGFGYGGVGFEGGRWDNDRFFYNRSVTNIGQVNIVNVYNQPVTVREVNRASFNGGPNGLDLKPSPGELAAAKEQHVAPTRDQLQNARAASRNESSFLSANQGKPRIAATAKPGDFKGPAVIRAKAAGGPLPAPGGAPGPNGAAPGTAGPKGAMTPEMKGATPGPVKTPLEKKIEEPKPEPTKTRPDNTLNPPKPGPANGGFNKPEPIKTPSEMKIERPKPEPTRPEPQFKPEPSRPEPMKVEPQNRPEPRRLEPNGMNAPKAGPQEKPQSRPERACGRPGEPPCR